MYPFCAHIRLRRTYQTMTCKLSVYIYFWKDFWMDLWLRLIQEEKSMKTTNRYFNQVTLINSFTYKSLISSRAIDRPILFHIKLKVETCIDSHRTSNKSKGESKKQSWNYEWTGQMHQPTTWWRGCWNVRMKTKWRLTDEVVGEEGTGGAH